MKKKVLIFLVMAGIIAVSVAGQASTRQEILLNGDWKFKNLVLTPRKVAVAENIDAPEAELLEGKWATPWGPPKTSKENARDNILSTEWVIKPSNSNWISYKELTVTDWSNYKALEFWCYSPKKLSGTFGCRVNIKIESKWPNYTWVDISLDWQGWKKIRLEFDKAITNEEVKKAGWKEVIGFDFFTGGMRDGKNPLSRYVSKDQPGHLYLSGMKLITREFELKEPDVARDGEGLSQKWYRPDYDDSSWSDFAIPFAGGDRKVNEIDWLRRDFTLPAVFKNRRILLRFEKLPYVSWIWVNGQPVHGKYPVDPKYGSTAAFQGYPAGFDYDITGLIKCDMKNTIAIRLFPWGGCLGYLQSSIDSIRVKAVPEVYLEEPLIRTTPEASKVSVNVRVVNSSKRGFAGRIDYLIQKKNAAKGSQRGTALTSVTVPAGSERELTFDLTFRGKPELWSPETPNLYSLELDLISVDQIVDALSSQFGFRTFEIRGRRFYLNSSPVFLRGTSYCVAFPWSPFDPKRFKKMKSLNCNFLRLDAKTPTNDQLALADKAGMMILLDPISGHIPIKAGPETTEEFYRICEREIPRWFRQFYNHPSVVMWCLLGEPFYSPVKFLNRLYDAAKKTDPYRPIMTGSGGPHVNFHSVNVKVADYETYKTDIISVHDYAGWYAHALVGIRDILARCEAIHPDKPLLCTENTGHYLYDEMTYRDIYRIQSTPNFASNWQRCTLTTKVIKEAVQSKNMTEVNRVLWNRKYLALKTMVEIQRMNKGRMAGALVYTDIMGIIDRLSKKEFSLSRKFLNTFKNVMAPLFTCAGFWKLNHFTGDSYEFPLYVINDSLKTMKDARVTVVVISSSGKTLQEKTYRFGNLIPDQNRQTVAVIKIGEWPTGDYSLQLTLHSGRDNKPILVNNYNFRVMSRSLLTRPISSSRRVSLLDAPDGDTKKVLKKLKIKFEHYTDLMKVPLDKYDVLIVGAEIDQKLNSKRSEVVAKWVTDGGRVLLWEQRLENATNNIFAVCPFFPSSWKPGHEAPFVDVARWTHSVFTGLEPEMFQRWNGDNHILVRGYFPRSPELLDSTLVQYPSGYKQSMIPVVLNFQCGQGEYFVSQLLAMKRFGDDPVASQYVMNVLDYVINQKIAAPEFVPPASRIGPGPFLLTKDGFIRHWLFCGPFPLPGGRPHYSRAEALRKMKATYDRDFLIVPSGTTSTVIPGRLVDITVKNIKPDIDLKHKTLFPKTDEGYWNLQNPLELVHRWRRIQSQGTEIRPIAYLMVKKDGEIYQLTNNIVFYAACYVFAPENMKAKIKIGSEDGFEAWLNHRCIGKNIDFRSWFGPDKDVFNVDFKRGENLLLLKLCQDLGGGTFCVRLTDLEDQPLTNVKIWLSNQ